MKQCALQRVTPICGNTPLIRTLLCAARSTQHLNAQLPYSGFPSPEAPCAAARIHTPPATRPTPGQGKHKACRHALLLCNIFTPRQHRPAHSNNPAMLQAEKDGHTWRWSYSCWKMRACHPVSVSMTVSPLTSWALIFTFCGLCRAHAQQSEEGARHNRAQKGCCACLLTSGGADTCRQQHRSLLRFCQRRAHC